MAQVNVHLWRIGLLVLCVLVSVSVAFYSPRHRWQPRATRAFSSARSLRLQETTTVDTTLDPAPLPRRYSTWQWRGQNINFRLQGPTSGTAILFVHGFGASVNHFRKNFKGFVDSGFCVHAVDLLGFGASDKPADVKYELELWRDMLMDFIEEKSSSKDQRWIVMGNSIGGLLTLMLAADLPERVVGAVLFNSAGGLTSFRNEELAYYYRPLWWFFRNVLFSDIVGPSMFERFRTTENVRSLLAQVYGVKEAVTDELVQILVEPGQDEGASQVFLKVMRAPAGPTPESYLERVQCPVLVLWGDSDPWTPLDKGMHPGIRFPEYCKDCKLAVLANTGHCPHDERPEEVERLIKEWMQEKDFL